MHVQHPFSGNLQITCFRTRVVMDVFLVLVCGTRAQNLSAPFSYTLHNTLHIWYLVTK
jgi:hypothetical protein